MPKLVVFEETYDDPIVTKSGLEEYENSIDSRLALYKSNDDFKKEVESLKQEMEQKIEEVKTSLTQQITQNQTSVMDILDTIKVKASTSEPEEPEENTVWFDIENKLVKVYSGSEWIPMGAVYQ